MRTLSFVKANQSVILFCLPARPQISRLFSEEERVMAAERAGRTQKVEAVGTIDKAQLKAGALDWRTYCGSIIYLGGNVVIGSTSSLCAPRADVWSDAVSLPSIVKGLGYTNADAQVRPRSFSER